MKQSAKSDEIIDPTLLSLHTVFFILTYDVETSRKSHPRMEFLKRL